MKRFLIFLAVLGIALGGLLFWWQRNARQVIAGVVRERAGAFVLNADNLTVTNDPVQMISFSEARVPKLVISGKELLLKDGPTLASAKLVIHDLKVAGPPFDFAGIKDGTFTVTVSDAAVTDFLRKRGVNFASVVHIPLDTLSVNFLKPNETRLRGAVKLPLGKQVALTATGKLVTAATPGKIDFKVKQVNVPIGGDQVAAALEKLNPVVDLTEWPVVCTVTKISSGKGAATISGTITGIRTKSLIP
jgi:hypothetical protein